MPNTIAQNLTRLQNARTAIAEAIVAKGGTVNSGDGLEDFASDIGTISSGGGNNIFYPVSIFISPTATITTDNLFICRLNGILLIRGYYKATEEITLSGGAIIKYPENLELGNLTLLPNYHSVISGNSVTRVRDVTSMSVNHNAREISFQFSGFMNADANIDWDVACIET